MLHANINYVGRVAGDASEESGRGGHENKGGKRATRWGAGFHFFVNAKASCGICYLAEERGGELWVQTGVSSNRSMEAVRDKAVRKPTPL